MPRIIGGRCLAEGCQDTLQCAHPSDPQCGRTAPERCNAWLYPGKESWDVKLTRPGGTQCALHMNHQLGHSLSGQWTEKPAPVEHVNHPNHYGGDTTYETVKVLGAWGLGFLLGNTVKYISRAGKKDASKLVEDLKKGRWYLDQAIQRLERGEPLF